MIDILKMMGLGHLAPQMQDYWYNEMNSLDINSDNWKFIDVDGIEVIIDFKDCQRNSFEFGFGFGPSVEESHCIGGRDAFEDPPCIVLLSNPPTRIMFRGDPPVDEQGRVHPLRGLGYDFHPFQMRMLEAGWALRAAGHPPHQPATAAEARA